MNSALAHPAVIEEASAADELDALVQPIARLESIVASWEDGPARTVQALKGAIEELHKEALRRLIRALKDDPAAGTRLRAALADPVVYGVLRFHGLIKAPLAERVKLALDEVGPALATHGGGVELVALKPPDTVEVRLVGSCHGCPASGQTLSEGVEKSIRAHCPEITHVVQVSRAPAEGGTGAVTGADGSPTVHYISPFAINVKSGWLDAGSLADIPEGSVVERQIRQRSVLLSRRGDVVSCFDNRCAHLGMPLETGEISAGVITCPYHGFEYLLETGECLTAPEVQLRVHAVRVRGEQVQVRLED